MSDVSSTMPKPTATPVATGSLPFSIAGARLPLALVAAGAVAAIVGLIVAPARTWPNLLVDGFYFLSLSVAGMFFLATQRLVSSRWSAGLRRIPEAIMMGLPVAALLMLPLFLGRETLFVWTHKGVFDHEPDIAGKVTYLNVPFAFARMITVLVIWSVFTRLFRRASLAQDQLPAANLVYHQRLNRLSALFVVLFAFSFTSGAYDWIVSLDPSWFSTMFGVYVFAGTFVQGIAAVTLATVALRHHAPLAARVRDQQLHDLGKMLFAFSTFWAYIWTCQYLLIWYGNIPEEVTHYIRRTNGGWLVFFILNFLVNWVVPFAVLMSARGKMQPRRLRLICSIILVGRWLDLYMLIMPAFWPSPKLGPLEIIMAGGYGALAYLLFRRNLARAPLVPPNDPVLAADDRLGHSHA